MGSPSAQSTISTAPAMVSSPYAVVARRAVTPSSIPSPAAARRGQSVRSRASRKNRPNKPYPLRDLRENVQNVSLAKYLPKPKDAKASQFSDPKEARKLAGPAALLIAYAVFVISGIAQSSGSETSRDETGREDTLVRNGYVLRSFHKPRPSSP